MKKLNQTLDVEKVMKEEFRKMLREDRFEEITKAMADLYKAKNKDYGNSFQKVRDKFPNAILIRLNDKMHRLESIMDSGVIEVKDESIDDTLLDLANYCVLELVERSLERANKKGVYMQYEKDIPREPFVDTDGKPDTRFNWQLNMAGGVYLHVDLHVIAAVPRTPMNIGNAVLNIKCTCGTTDTVVAPMEVYVCPSCKCEIHLGEENVCFVEELSQK